LTGPETGSSNGFDKTEADRGDVTVHKKSLNYANYTKTPGRISQRIGCGFFYASWPGKQLQLSISFRLTASYYFDLPAFTVPRLRPQRPANMLPLAEPIPKINEYPNLSQICIQPYKKYHSQQLEQHLRSFLHGPQSPIPPEPSLYHPCCDYSSRDGTCDVRTTVTLWRWC